MATDVGSSVHVERRGRALLVTIDRPDARNAVDLRASEAIGRALDELDADDALAVGIVTGANGWFSSGMDLRAFAEGERPWIGDRGFGGIVRRGSVKPLIAAVEGFAVAGGFEIALACDLIVAARGARFALPEVKRSIVASAGGLLRLPRRLPHHLAMEMILTGDPQTAERLHELGLVNRLVEPGRAVEAALELAERIAANGPLALRASKAIVERAPDWPTTEMWTRQDELADPVLASDDAREGARAFVEKRPPVWRGR